MEAKWLEARAEGLSPADAAREAGYKDPFNAAYRLSRSASLIAYNQAVMQAHGIDMPMFVQVLKSCLRAERTIKVGTGKDQYTEVVPDYDIRLRAVVVGVQLAGMMPSEEHKYIPVADEETNEFLIPSGYEDMDEEQLLKDVQMRRQAAVMGTPIREKVDDADNERA